MFKKLLIASAVLALSSSVAFAAANYKGEYKGEVAAPACPTYNPPVAPYIGLSLGNRINYSSTSRAFDGIVGTLSGGYGGIIAPSWYLAGEIFVDGVIKVKDFSRVNALSLQTTYDYGASLIPGYMITDHLLGFIRLGAIGTRFNNQGTNPWGGQFGIGGQTNLCQNWDIRAEYDYIYYGSTGNVGHPNTLMANVGVIYRFA